APAANQHATNHIQRMGRSAVRPVQDRARRKSRVSAATVCARQPPPLAVIARSPFNATFVCFERAVRIKSASDFFELESASGIVLVAAAIVALAIANSPLAGLYESVIDVKLSIAIGTFGLSKPLYLWINDGLMAVFFFLIGLEVKREMLDGELSSASQIV